MWILVYNTATTSVPLDGANRFVTPSEFAYADDTDPRVIAGLGRGWLLNVPITFDPNGSPVGIDPEAYLAAKEVVVRNGGTYVPPPVPVAPYTLAELDTLVRTGRLSSSSVVSTVVGKVGSVSAQDIATALATLGFGNGTDPEGVRDTIAAALAGVQGVTVTVDDAGDTITIGLSGVAISRITGLQAALDNALSRSSHTGTQPASSISDFGPAVDARVGTTVLTRVASLRPQQVVRSLVRQAPFAEANFPMRIVPFDPTRRRLIVQNLGPGSVNVGFKNANNNDFNTGATPVTIAAGREWVAPNSQFTCFARMVTNGESTALSVYTETVV